MNTNDKLIDNNKSAICRVCMQSEEHNLFPIFDNVFSGDNSITVADIITECTKYPVSQNDQLPVQICKLCMEAARNAHHFKRQTEEAYRRLKAIFDIKWVPKEETNHCDNVSRGGVINTDKYTQTDKHSVYKCESCSKERSSHTSDENEGDTNLPGLCSFAGEYLANETCLEYKCNICSQEFYSRNHLSQHQIQDHMMSPKKSKAQVCKEYRERQKITKSPKMFSRPGTKTNAQKCKEYRERQKMKEDANSRSERNAIKCKEYRDKIRMKKDLENPKVKATLEEPEIENEEDDDIESITNPFASDEEDFSVQEEDVKQFVETMTHPGILKKDDPNEIIDEYSYDDMDESIIEPEAILLESETDDVEFVSSSDSEPQYYHQYNKNIKSSSAIHNNQQNWKSNKVEFVDNSDYEPHYQHHTKNLKSSSAFHKYQNNSETDEVEFVNNSHYEPQYHTKNISIHKYQHSSDTDEVKLANNGDYEPQYYHQYNKNVKSFPATNRYQQNATINMFRCKICHMEFKLRRILIRHMLTHNDERPFSCHLCLKTFKRKDNLQKHLREVHQKNFSCDVCFEKFGTFKRLIRHSQTNHRTSIKSK